MKVKMFYQHRHFDGERGLPNYRRTPYDNFSIICNDDTPTSYFYETRDTIVFQRFGVLRGEYAVDETGIFAVDRGGNIIILQCSWDDISAVQIAQHLFNTDNVNRILDLASQFDSLPRIERPVVICNPYHNNYFHFVMETITTLRFFNHGECGRALVPSSASCRLFQKELLSLALNDEGYDTLASQAVLVDPCVSYADYCGSSIRWLKQKIRITPQALHRRVFVRRRNVTRPTTGVNNNVAETPEFLSFLERHGFSICDFGVGDTPFVDQISMINGADIVLMVHGAGFVNLIFCQNKTTTIEIASRARINGAIPFIMSELGNNHYSIVQNKFDMDGNIVVDTSVLEAVMADIERKHSSGER
jgi:hypothetical protein